MPRSLATLIALLSACVEGPNLTIDPPQPVDDAPPTVQPHYSPLYVYECRFYLPCDAFPASPGASLATLHGWARIDVDWADIVSRITPASEWPVGDDDGWGERMPPLGHRSRLEDWTAPEQPGTYILEVRATAMSNSPPWTFCEDRGESPDEHPHLLCPAPDDAPAGFDPTTMRLIEVVAP